METAIRTINKQRKFGVTTYHKFQKLNIDHSVIDLDQNISDVNYFCTPVGAKVIGEAGVDGIHYCFIEGFDEMVFAISPSSFPGENVHPIAKNFEDLLRLLLACGSMDAIEQTYMWDEELFEQYIMDNKPDEKQCAVMDIIKKRISDHSDGTAIFLYERYAGFI